MRDISRSTIEALAPDAEALMERLEIYEAQIRKWNPKINLVAPRSLGELWERHFIDSLQLVNHVPRGTMTTLDVGSGGGFPALVLAAAMPETSWTLVESDQRKSVFLRQTAREMGLNVQVEAIRIENLPAQSFDLITARALANLDQLLNWTVPFQQENTIFIFPKGKSWKTELTEAKVNWQMKAEHFPSRTDSEAKILRISEVMKR